MIFTAIFLLGAAVFAAFLYAFSSVLYVVPDSVIDSFETFFGYARLVDGLFPFMSDVLLAIGAVLTVWILKYTIKLAMWVYAVTPWMGKNADLPKHTITTTRTMTSFNGGRPSERYEVQSRRVRRFQK